MYVQSLFIINYIWQYWIGIYVCLRLKLGNKALHCMLICKRFHYEQAEKTLLRLGQGPIFLSKPKARSILDTRNLALRIFGNPENFSSSFQLPSCQLWTYLPKQFRCNCIIPSPMAPSLLRHRFLPIGPWHDVRPRSAAVDATSGKSHHLRWREVTAFLVNWKTS